MICRPFHYLAASIVCTLFLCQLAIGQPSDPCATAGDKLLAHFNVKDDKALKIELRKIFNLSESELREESTKKSGGGKIGIYALKASGSGGSSRTTLEELKKEINRDDATALTDNSKRTISILTGDEVVAHAWVECLKIRYAVLGWTYRHEILPDGTRAILYVKFQRNRDSDPVPVIEQVIPSGCSLTDKAVLKPGMKFEHNQEYSEEVRLTSVFDGLVRVQVKGYGTLTFMIPAKPLAPPATAPTPLVGRDYLNEVDGVKVLVSGWQDENATQLQIRVGGAIGVKQGGKSLEPARSQDKKLGERPQFLVKVSPGASFVAETRDKLVTYKLVKMPTIEKFKNVGQNTDTKLAPVTPPNVVSDTEFEVTVTSK